jgi:uncharacterized membrane protein YfcA
MFDVSAFIAIAGTFFIAGAVKGVIGLGLPTVSLGLLTAIFDLTTAMGLLLVPSFVTNIWQAVVGGNGRAILLRIWPFLLMATLTVSLGATALTRVDMPLLTGLLGGLLVTYALLSLIGFHSTISAQHEVSAGLLFGSVNGILTGMTGSFVVPGVMFLQGIGLSRNHLVQAMGMLFTVSTVALALALHGSNLFTPQIGTVSALAVIPATAGMVTGQLVRQRLSEHRFRQLFFGSIFVLGTYIVVRAALGNQ